MVDGRNCIIVLMCISQFAGGTREARSNLYMGDAEETLTTEITKEMGKYAALDYSKQNQQISAQWKSLPVKSETGQAVLLDYAWFSCAIRQQRTVSHFCLNALRLRAAG